jgi:HSP20 family protein
MSSQSQRGDAGISGTAGGGGGYGTGSRTDQERQRQVIREGGGGAGGGTMMGTGSRGMQRTGTGQRGAGTALAERGQGQGQLQGQGQPMLLPAFMANPGLMASAFMTNPFAFTQAMSQEMDRLFSSFGNEDLGSSYGQAGSGLGRGLTTSGAQQGDRGLGQFTPQIEVVQRGDDLVILADLPGVDPDEVDIVIDDGVLTLSGDRQQSGEGNSYGSERSYGNFSRSFTLPEGVDEDQVRASFDNGVLEIVVVVPDEQQTRGRHVPIESGARQASGQRQAGRGAGQSGATSGASGATSGAASGASSGASGATSGASSGATSAGQSAGRHDAGGGTSHSAR